MNIRCPACGSHALRLTKTATQHYMGGVLRTTSISDRRVVVDSTTVDPIEQEYDVRLFYFCGKCMGVVGVDIEGLTVNEPAVLREGADV